MANWKIIAKSPAGEIVWESGPHQNYQLWISLLPDLNRQNPEAVHEVVLA